MANSFLAIFRQLFQGLRRTGMIGALLPLALLLAVGTVTYAWLEGWSLLDALYATVITLTTVGYGDLTPQTPQGRIFAVFFTIGAIGMASYAISTLASVVFDFQRTKRARILEKRRMKALANLTDHIIVCGGNVLAHRTANEFLRTGTPFLLVEEDEEVLRWALLWLNQEYVRKRQEYWSSFEDIDFSREESMTLPELADEMGILYLHDDPTDEQVLIRAGIGRASGIISALDDDRDNISVVLSARDLAMHLKNDTLTIIARVHDELNMRRIYLAGAHKVISPNFVGGFQIANHMLHPAVGEFWEQMLFFNDQNMGFHDFILADHPKWVGETVGKFHRDGGHTVLAIKRDGNFIYAPKPEQPLQQDDVLILMGGD